jgi:hypothetical protein
MRLVGFEADFLADCFRESLQNLLMPQKNGPHLSKLSFDVGEPLVDASKPFIKSSGHGREVGLKDRLVVDKTGLGGKEVCHCFLQPSLAVLPGRTSPRHGGSLARPEIRGPSSKIADEVQGTTDCGFKEGG